MHTVSTADLGEPKAMDVVRRATRKVAEAHAHIDDCFIVALVNKLEAAGVDIKNMELVRVQEHDGLRISSKLFIREKEKTK